jgi:hypothetical protein
MINRNKVFVLFSLSFFILIFTLENINGRFWLNDFKVYYLAAKALLSGSQVYGTVFGLDTGYYKYSPFILLLFTPFCLLSFYAASVIQFILIAASTLVSMLVIQYILSNFLFDSQHPRRNRLLSLGILCVVGHLFRELHMGNVNMIVVLLLSMGLLFTLENNAILSGICIGIAIMIKPYFLLLMLPLFLYKKIKTMQGIVAVLIFAVIVPFVVFGFFEGASLHQQWIASMVQHNTYITSNQNIQAIIAYYSNSSISNSVQYYVMLIIVIAYVGFFYYSRRLGKKWQLYEKVERTSFIIGYFMMFAIIPNILLTDTEHFIFSLPLILFLLNYLAVSKNYVAIGGFVVLIFFYGCNSPDIIGSVLFNKFDRMGLIGISNLVLIGSSVYLALKYKGALIPVDKSETYLREKMNSNHR